MRMWQVLLCVAVIIIVLSGAGYAQDAPTFPVSGKVLLPDGSPAAGADVEARSTSRDTDWKVEATATSDTDGKFTTQLKKGSYRFRAVLGDLVYLDLSEQIDVAADGSLSKPIEMRLEKGCKVQGSVIDIATDQPVGGVKLFTREGDHAQSDDSGKWSMVVLRHNQAITAIKDDYWSPIVNFNAAVDAATVKVEIKPGGTIKGRVIDEQGKPIADVRIRVGNTGYFSLLGAKTDTEGQFVLGGQDPDSQVEISANAEGYEYLREQPVTFPAGQRETQIELTLKKPKVRTISGRVTRPDGSPVEGAKVAYGDGTSYANYVFTNTDKDGRYAIKNAAIRGSLVVVSGSCLAPVYKPVGADKDVTMDFQVRPGYTVPGCIEDEDGHPIEGAHVWAYMDVADPGAQDRVYEIAYTQTNKDGRFALLSMPKNQIYVSVAGKDYDRLENERLKVDGTDYTLVLRKTVPGQICGIVVKDPDGKPVSEFNVRLGFSRAGKSSGLSTGLTKQGVSFQAADGKFVINGLTVGDGYQVIATATGYLEGVADPVLVTAAKDRKDTVIRLRPAHSFEGSVTAAGTGAPVEGVLVTAWNSSGTDGSYRWEMSGTILKSVSTRTDAAGKFKFDSMPFAFGMVFLEKPGLARTILKSVSFSRPLRTSMEKGATLTGSIVDDQGEVPSGVWLSLDHADLNVGFHAEINPDGSFKIEDLPPGQYFVGQYKESRPSRTQTFELKAGETYQLDWAKQGAVIVEGKVTQNGKPVAKAHISVNSRKRGMNWAGGADTGADGSYKLSLLKPGEFFFSCMLGEWTDPNHIRSGKTLQLTAGANRVDFKLPCGSISGRLVAKSGKPLAGTTIRLYIKETYEQKMGRGSLSFQTVKPHWWPENQCNTDKNGVFIARNLRAGNWMICIDPGAVPAAVVTLADGEVKSGLVAKAPRTGSAKIKPIGMKEMPNGIRVTCADQYGRVYYPKRANDAWTMEFNDLSVGKLKATVLGDGWLQSQVEFIVRPNQTTSVPIKLFKGPRIVFKPTADSDDLAPVTIGFKITTPDGKPVLVDSQGLCWGDLAVHDPQQGQIASVTLKPGKYLVKAGAAVGDRRNYGDAPELTGYSGMVTVAHGKDAIIEVPLNK